MQDSNYFTYGYPMDARMPIYGLYQPVLNCFLLVLPDYPEIGPRLTAILSSRYLLQPILLNLASNYDHNVIDNEICQDWTFSNAHQVPYRSLMSNFKIIKAELLIPTKVTVEWNIEQEKQWAQFCLFWLRFIKDLETNGICGLWIDQQIGNHSFFDLFGSVIKPEIKQFIDQTIKLLYLGQDLKTTEQKIMDLLNCNSFLQRPFKSYYESTNTAN
jgi:hypothetical protein